jgi:mono/diheme cytochrome c family protein
MFRANPESGIAVLKRVVLAIVLGVLAYGIAATRQAAAIDANNPGESDLNVPQLFATTCGWCHAHSGREQGRGPKLMDTKRSDDFIRYRIQHGKEGAMPSFGAMFSDADIDRIIAYIRNLKPDPE